MQPDAGDPPRRRVHVPLEHGQLQHGGRPGLDHADVGPDLLILVLDGGADGCRRGGVAGHGQIVHQRPVFKADGLLRQAVGREETAHDRFARRVVAVVIVRHQNAP